MAAGVDPQEGNRLITQFIEADGYVSICLGVRDETLLLAPIEEEGSGIFDEHSVGRLLLTDGSEVTATAGGPPEIEWPVIEPAAEGAEALSLALIEKVEKEIDIIDQSGAKLSKEDVSEKLEAGNHQLVAAERFSPLVINPGMELSPQTIKDLAGFFRNLNQTMSAHLRTCYQAIDPQSVTHLETVTDNLLRLPATAAQVQTLAARTMQIIERHNDKIMLAAETQNFRTDGERYVADSLGLERLQRRALTHKVHRLQLESAAQVEERRIEELQRGKGQLAVTGQLSESEQRLSDLREKIAAETAEYGHVTRDRDYLKGEMPRKLLELGEQAEIGKGGALDLKFHYRVEDGKLLFLIKGPDGKPWKPNGKFDVSDEELRFWKAFLDGANTLVKDILKGTDMPVDEKAIEENLGEIIEWIPCDTLAQTSVHTKATYLLTKMYRHTIRLLRKKIEEDKDLPRQMIAAIKTQINIYVIKMNTLNENCTLMKLRRRGKRNKKLKRACKILGGVLGGVVLATATAAAIIFTGGIGPTIVVGAAILGPSIVGPIIGSAAVVGGATGVAAATAATAGGSDSSDEAEKAK